jgi:hypothetical protein
MYEKTISTVSGKVQVEEVVHTWEMVAIAWYNMI